MLKQFWKTSKEKRQEFLDKLKGIPTFEVNKNTPIGAVFMLTNQNTGAVDTYVYTGNDRWYCCGTGPRADTFTGRQLEMHLSKLVRESDANSIYITDQGWVKQL